MLFAHLLEVARDRWEAVAVEAHEGEVGEHELGDDEEDEGGVAEHDAGVFGLMLAADEGQEEVLERRLLGRAAGRQTGLTVGV